jgi:hypothetical protein
MVVVKEVDMTQITCVSNIYRNYLEKIIKKSKAVPLQHAGAKWDKRYSSCSFLTLALDGMSDRLGTRCRE